MATPMIENSKLQFRPAEFAELFLVLSGSTVLVLSIFYVFVGASSDVGPSGDTIRLNYPGMFKLAGDI